MALTIIPASHEPKAHPSIQPVSSALELLQHSCPDCYDHRVTRLVASSFDHADSPRNSADVYPSSSSLVRSAIEAWGRHSHLVIRPDDVWFTILVQMNFYMEAHAEDVRHLFVAHEGKEKLDVEAECWQFVIAKLRSKLEMSIKTSWMADWVSPGFSTSTTDDEITATVLMMGLTKKYFKFSGGITCGIPSITLLGTKADWQRLLDKTERLRHFAAPVDEASPLSETSEPVKYYQRLRPLLTRIVGSFDAPDSSETKSFWDNMVQAKIKHDTMCGAPPKQYMVTGWILGLHYWDSSGRKVRAFSDGEAHWGYDYKRPYEPLVYDGVRYGATPLDNIPAGYAKAPFTMKNCHGGKADEKLEGWVLAGSVAKKITHGAPASYATAMKRAEKQHGRGGKWFSGFPGLLGCMAGLCGSSGADTTGPASEPVQHTKEKPAVTSEAEKSSGQTGHSTIQPLSGWFLFGPEIDAGPFFDRDELTGPTVDALESCDNVEKYGRDGLRSYD